MTTRLFAFFANVACRFCYFLPCQNENPLKMSNSRKTCAKILPASLDESFERPPKFLLPS